MVVMNMEKFRNKVNFFYSFNGSQLEKGKVFFVVKIIVNMIMEEIILVVNKVEGYIV